jgi:phosphoribosyl 1,2-cyclic phosphodiesterase
MQFIPHYSGSKGNLYELRSDTGTLLIDPGVSIKLVKQALKFKLSGVDGVLSGHLHRDHCKAIPELVRAGIDCWMLPETAESLKVSGHRVKIIEPMKQFQIGKWSVLPFPVPHDVPNVGFLISDGEDKLLYLCDCFYCHYRFKGLTMIAIGINWSKETLNPDLNPARKKRLYHSHMSLENAKKFFLANDLSKVRSINVLHVSPENGDAKMFCEEIRKWTGVPTYHV